MASTTANNHSPRSSVESPQSRRAARAPWTQIVRGGGESEPIISSFVMASEAPSSPSSSAAFNEQATSSSDWSPSKLAAAPEEEVQPESSDSNAAKKPAWNKPSNGALEVGPVMGADSWPPLSESTRASPKSSSESLKALSDGSAPQVSGIGIASSSSQKQTITNNANTSLTQNHATPARPKFTRRGVGSSSGSVSDNGGSLQPPLPSPGSAVEMPSNNAGKSGSVLLESSPREHTHKESGQRGGFGSQSHSGNDHTQQRNSFRRGNGGPHPRGDGSYHHNYGNRRDQDRGNHDWNPPHRSFNGRDAHMHPQRVVPRSYNRHPPPSSPQFMPPPPMPVRSFGVYPDVASSLFYLTPSPDPLRGLPIVTPMPHHAMYYPVPDPQLHTKIVSQIDYYFSNENLIKDTFLRQNMDDQGWVPIKLIAGFKKVALLTDNIQLILDAVRISAVVEVQGDKMRRRNDWKRWIMPLVQAPTVSSPQSLGRSNYDTLTANMQSVSLEEKNNKQGQAEAFLSRSSSGDLSSQSQPSSSEAIGQGTFQVGSERSFSTRSSTK